MLPGDDVLDHAVAIYEKPSTGAAFRPTVDTVGPIDH